MSKSWRLSKKERKKDEESILRNKIAKRKYKRIAQRLRTIHATYYILLRLGGIPREFHYL